MTYDKDPIRWSAEGSDAPDLLRDIMQAGAQEGPSAAQLGALSAKVGGLSAAGAATTGATGAAKLWLAGAAVTALVAGGAMLRPAATEPAPAAAEMQAGEATPEIAAPSTVGAAGRPAVTTAPAPVARRVAAPEAAVPVEATLDSTQEAASPEVAAAKPEAATRAPKARRNTRPSRARRATSATATPARRAAAPQPLAPSEPRYAKPSGATGPTDVQLLHQARQALASSPRRALELARDHKAAYPRSQFSQERDVLVIEALTRAGQLDRARSEASRFVKRYPNSAHAHRFQERLGLD